jgi:DEAD/DEAH box helicase domain-containing protein
VLAAAFDALCDVGLAVEERSERDVRLWALCPDALRITTEVMAVDCPGHAPLHIPAPHADAWIGLPLISAADPDQVYQRCVAPRESLYSNQYRNGEIHRVIAHEHTGLLPSSERLRVEESFINGKKPWEYNLLSATPTLEMGIDIGSLSSVLLCSVPPAQSNYLQRVGRGGRRDGNSFVLTVANGRPHDLVFYADPGRMLDAPVEPPSVFLKARHVLRRQLLAYTMDCWTASTGGANQIPATMQPVLDAVEKTKEDSFPYTLLNFLKQNMQEIWDGFIGFVATDLGDDDRELLRQYLFGGPQHQDDHLPLYVLGRLKRVADERKTMSDAVKALDKTLAALNKQPQDEHRDAEIAELERESAGYRSLRIRLNRRETLNFFTDEGLLPNYAFPEEGATLHSVIFRSEKVATADGGEREYVKREYEYQRPAQAALTELAPDSVFYAGDRRVSISRVETARGRNIQDWRFCPRCHYSASAEDPTSGFGDPCCPRCKTAQWGDESARTKMLKMTQVYAFTSAKEAQLSDYSDDREPEFFSKQMLIDFEPADIAITWVLDNKDRSFGFEFLRSARFLEVNFGRRDGEDLFFDVAGENLQRSGFTVCRECGSVQPRKGEAQHLKSCSFSRGPKKLADGSEDGGIENCLYLYREFSSEGLRILLPRLATGGTEEQVNSFVAALQLGLKRRFGGKVDHLRVAYQSEPVGGGDDRRHFIVLYDSVPGGTGYLHELLSKADHMQEVFQLAYDVMVKCDCYASSMDGCYRCLLQYRNAYGMESTRKSVALEMLKEIVDGDYEWVQQAESLSTLKANPWVDSELESRFPEAIAAFSGADCVNQQKVRVTKDVVRGKIGARVSIGDTAYDMEPQVDLGLAEGVQFASRPDFVLWPAHAGHRAVAIFLDGYQYHDKTCGPDLLKRQSLMRAGYVVWSLNWYDVNQVVGDKAMYSPLPTGMTAPDYPHQAVAQLAQKAGVGNFAEHINRTSFELLMHFLMEQDSKALANQGLFLALQCLPAKTLADADARARVLESLHGLPVAFTDQKPHAPALAGDVELSDNEGAATVRLRFLAGRELLDDFDLSSAMVTLCYDLKPGQEKVALYQWQRFWGAVNFLQFLPLFFGYTPQSKQDGTAAGLEWPSEHSAEVVSGVAGEQEWYTLLDESLVEALRAAEPVWPEDALVGEDVLDADGEVIGNAEVMFVTAKVVYLAEEELDLQPVLEAEGWEVCLTIEALIQALTHQKEEA